MKDMAKPVRAIGFPTEDQRKSFIQRFLEELQRAAVETLTPTGQQRENERERGIEEIRDMQRRRREAGFPDLIRRPITPLSGGTYSTLDEYINRTLSRAVDPTQPIDVWLRKR